MKMSALMFRLIGAHVDERIPDCAECEVETIVEGDLIGAKTLNFTIRSVGPFAWVESTITIGGPSKHVDESKTLENKAK